MTDLAKRTWPEAGELFGEQTVALLPIGATEPHGPHLPLDVDVTIALAQSRRAAEILRADGVQAVVLPPLSFGVTNYTDGFAGRVSLRPGTLWAVLEDVVKSLEEQEIRQVVFSNGHHEPAHVKVLRGVEIDHPTRGKQRAQVLFPDATRRRWAETLGEEFQSGDCHAGRYETSIVLACDAEGVREQERRRLAPLRIELLEKMQRGVRTFHEAGAVQAYCGDPAAATMKEGFELIHRLGKMIATSVRETWPDLFAQRP